MPHSPDDVSSSPIRFVRREAPIIPRRPGTFHSVHSANPDLWLFRDRFHLYFRGQGAEGHDQIGVAFADPRAFDGKTWRMHEGNPILRVGAGRDDFDSGHILDPATVVWNGRVFLYYSAHHVDWKTKNVPSRVGLAVSEDGVRFEKHPANPILPGTAPEAIVHDGKIHLFLQRRNSEGAFEIWRFESRDGIRFPESGGRPVFFPSHRPGAFDRYSISTARILRDEDWFYLFYGGCPRFHDYPCAIGLARSRDLDAWERYPGNPVFSRGEPGAWDEAAVWFATVHKERETCFLWYEGAGTGNGAGSAEARRDSDLCRREDYGGYGRVCFSQVGLALLERPTSKPGPLPYNGNPSRGRPASRPHDPSSIHATETLKMCTRAILQLLALCLSLVPLSAPGAAQEPANKTAADPSAENPPSAAVEEKPLLSADTLKGLEWRGIGPAFMSGRVVDIAKDPRNRNTWYVAAASGGVWKTVNAGTTFTPVFDEQGSYSIGCVTVDPADPLVIWVGTGENNSQRSVGYGDGVYKSVDGGKNWKNVGLKDSEHIGKILVDPRDSDVVYVAAQGPLWAPGGDRGLYKTKDGGATWERVLQISENTGVSDIAFDPRDPDILYASAYQRRRRVWTLIDGGPESALYKTRNGGAAWEKLEKGLPEGNLGRIGIAVSPQRPDVVYALVEAERKKGGFFRSIDAGATWEKRSDYNPTSPQYYQEIFCDPHVFDRVYSMDTWIRITDDGGKTFHGLDEKFKHVDDHAVVFDPDDPEYLLYGCDGGIYETFDRGTAWDFKANLPVTQFYKCCVDNALPFYNVCGGTQDNNTQIGPSRTLNVQGILNSDWSVLIGGDGFKPQADPEDPNIYYGQSQYGVLVRFDRASGERINIQPQPEASDEPLRWNWDSPLIVSPHDPARIYFAAQRIFRSDDRGDSWRPVSPDLTRRIDRNTLEVMGRVWSVDAVAKSESTSFYGNIVSLAESPLVEGLLYAGTDDGLIQVSEDGGATWRRVDGILGIPELSYVSDIEASISDPDTVYASFSNHKSGDFKPYIQKSKDRGRTWTSLAGDLPARGSVWCLALDSVREDLLFAGTEFGVFFSCDGGVHWVQLKGGLPTIAVRDLEIQRREGDLAAATFGRGFYILEDFSPLRDVSEARLDEEAIFFPVKRALMYIPMQPLGGREKGAQGDAFFSAPNPPFGAIFTYYLKEDILTLKEQRQRAEKKTLEEGGKIAYPTWAELEAEDAEEPPAVLLIVRSADGETVRRVDGPVKKGFHRVAWDLRFPAFTPARIETDPDQERSGPAVVPGVYTVSLEKRVRGQSTPLSVPQTFEAVPLGLSTMPAADRGAVLAFQEKTGRLQRAALGAQRVIQETESRLALIKQAIDETPGTDGALAKQARDLEARLREIKIALMGDETRTSRMEPAPLPVLERVQDIVYGDWYSSTSDPTLTQKHSYEVAADQFTKVLQNLRVLVEEDFAALDKALEAAGAPWTPGRFPRWERE